MLRQGLELQPGVSAASGGEAGPAHPDHSLLCGAESCSALACGRGRAPSRTPALGHGSRASRGGGQRRPRCESCFQPPVSEPHLQRVSGRGASRGTCLASQVITPRPRGEESIESDRREGVSSVCVWLASRERGCVPPPRTGSQACDCHQEPTTKRQSEGGLGRPGGVRRVRPQNGETLRPIWPPLRLRFKSPSAMRAQSSLAGSHVTPGLGIRLAGVGVAASGPAGLAPMVRAQEAQARRTGPGRCRAAAAPGVDVPTVWASESSLLRGLGQEGGDSAVPP